MRQANPALQGQNLYTRADAASLANMDKQIFRLVGKATTLAAMAYRVRQGRPFVQPPSACRTPRRELLPSLTRCLTCSHTLPPLSHTVA